MRTIALLALILSAAAGCQDRRFAHVGGGPAGKEYGMLLKSIDAYAKKNGLTRNEAIRELRTKADWAAAEGQNSCCPGHGHPQHAHAWATPPRVGASDPPGHAYAGEMPAAYESRRAFGAP